MFSEHVQTQFENLANSKEQQTLKKSHKDFKAESEKVHEDIKKDMRTLANGLVYHYKHPEVHHVIPDESTIEDWFWMRDPYDVYVTNKNEYQMK